MATLCLINFPEFSESKEILKIGRSEVCVWVGVLKVGLLNCPSLYVFIFQCFIGHTVTQASYAHIVYNKFDNLGQNFD